MEIDFDTLPGDMVIKGAHPFEPLRKNLFKERESFLDFLLA